MSTGQGVFIEQRELISDLYKNAPVFEPVAICAWQMLGGECVRQLAQLRTQMEIVLTDDPEPYVDADAMLVDVGRGYLLVSRANSEHPVWTVEENVAFRVAHDVLGHGRARSGFSWIGEDAACAAHAPLCSYLARRALFTECIGQTAFRSTEGYFPEQKTVFLDRGFDLSKWC